MKLACSLTATRYLERYAKDMPQHFFLDSFYKSSTKLLYFFHPTKKNDEDFININRFNI